MNSIESCLLAIWDDGALDLLAADIAEAGLRFGVQVDRLPRGECERRLRAGLVDAALVPSVNVLSNSDAFETYAPVAISAWCAPHASVHLRHGLQEHPSTLDCPEDVDQERLMARIVLREHYGMQPDVVMSEGEASPDEPADSTLLVGALGTAPKAPYDEGVTLDLGQEWFELTAYPMVWGLIVARVGESDPRILLSLKEAMGTDDDDEGRDISDLVSDSSLRFRFDDMAMASLTELAELLFFNKVTADVPDMRFVPDPEALQESEEDDDAEFEL